MGSNTDFLFARPSFLEGFSRVLDISGTLDSYNSCKSGEEADARAIKSDFRAVGNEIRKAAKNSENNVR